MTGHRVAWEDSEASDAPCLLPPQQWAVERSVERTLIRTHDRMNQLLWNGMPNLMGWGNLACRQSLCTVDSEKPSVMRKLGSLSLQRS